MKYYFKTYGCRVNQYETQLIREQFCKNSQNTIVDDIADADVCIINSCTVTHKADADCRQIVRRILKLNPLARIIVTGCYALSSPDEIKSACKNSQRVEVCPDKEKLIGSLKHTNYFYDHQRAFLKIQDGCDAFCSYCIVPYVRSKLWSKDRETVFDEIEVLRRNDYREIVLCGIRLGKYGTENHGLYDLVKDILTNFRDMRIKFSSLELGEIDEKLVDLIGGSKNIVPYLHIPMQSGDDKILELMKRSYSRKDYSEKIKYIKSQVPDIFLSTDVIVGFPTETNEQFYNTYRLIKELKFNKLHIFTYSDRKGTSAEKIYPKVSSIEIKKRAGMLRELGVQ